MKPPSGECNGDIGAADTSENKNVTPALVMLLAALVGPLSEWVRAGLGDLAAGSSARLHRPTNLTEA